MNTPTTTGQIIRFHTLLAALEHLIDCADDANWPEAVAYLPELEAVMEEAKRAVVAAKGATP